MAVQGTITLNTAFSQTISGIPSDQAAVLTNQRTLKANYSTAGSAADQVNLKYSKTLTLAATPTVLDLTSLTDVIGGAVSFAKVRSITIVNKSTTDGQTVLMGYATTTANAWTGLISNPGQVTIEPSTAANVGFFAATAPNTAGWAVSSSSKLLELDPGANTIVVDVEIVGA